MVVAEKQTRAQAARRRLSISKHWLAAGMLMLLCVASQLVMTLQGTMTFDSDEAVFGLMARHILQGQFPIYFYGQAYLGSAEATLAAGGLWLFGNTLLALRASTLLLFVVFLGLHYALTTRIWNAKVALLSLLFLAMPSPLVRMWTHRPITGLAIIFVLGTLLALIDLRGSKQRPLLVCGLVGAIVGFGLWSHPLFSIYVAAVGLSFGLASPEWAALYTHIRRRWLVPVGLLVAGALVLVAVFSSGCQIFQIHPLAITAARGTLALGALMLVGLLGWASPRRRALVASGLAMSAGFIVGNGPQWYAWLVLGMPQKPPVAPSCLSDAAQRVNLVLAGFVPSLWGIAPLPSARMFPTSILVLWWLAALVATGALICWVWVQRRTFAKCVVAAPLDPHERGVLIITILWALPLVLAVLSSNTMDMQSLRYVLLAWPSSAVMLALLIARLSARQVACGVGVMVFWIGAIGVPNVLDRSDGLPHYRTAYPLSTVAALETFLNDNHAQVGYADYWLAYTINFLSAERITLVPYDESHLYQPYMDKLDQAPVRAYVFPKTYINSKYRRKDFKKQVLYNYELWSMHRFALEPLERGTVLKRRIIGNLDVWLVKP